MIFFLEQKTFMIGSYFRNGVAIEDEWHYNSGTRVPTKISRLLPLLIFTTLLETLLRVFRETGSVHHKKGTTNVVYQ